MAQRKLNAAAYTVGWICALPIELAAAQAILDEEHLPHEDICSTQYTLGRIGSHNVVLICLPAGQMGVGAAAFSAGQAMSNFTSIRFGLMVGVGGGVPNADADVRLGDVVVSQPVRQHSGVVQYDFGKTGQGGRMTRTGSQNAPPKVLLHAITQLRAHHYRDRASLAMHLSIFDQHPYFSREKAGPDILFEAAYHHNGGTVCEQCSKDHIVQRTIRRADEEVSIHYGTIASGNQIIKDGVTRDRLSKELGGVLCFEMEAAGLMNDFSCLVVRGICDYADSHKNKAWQPYAAAVAAACAKAILLLVPATEVEVAKITGVREACKYRIPFDLKGVPVGKFAERPRDMYALEQVLLPQEDTKARRLLVTYGLGGMGKTQLAANFSRRHQHSFSSVLWLDGSSESSLKQSFATFASRIPAGQISEASRLYTTSQDSDIDLVVRDVLGWLSTADNSNWLLVVDNVDRDDRRCDEDAEAYNVEEYIPGADHGSVLITTRLLHLAQLGEKWEVKRVNKEQAQAIFKSWYGKGVDQSGDELLGLLDGLPLALAQAAAYMSETGTSFDTYTRLYKEQWRELMEPHNRRRMPLRSYSNGSVATTWTISYMAVRASNEEAANLLLLWAHLDNKSLWHGLLAAASQESVIAADTTTAWLGEIAHSEIEFTRAIGTLRSYSLVEETGDQTGHSTHPVVHQWALHMQNNIQRAALSWLAIVLVGLAVPMSDEMNYWEVQAQLLPHAEECKKRIGEVIENHAEEQRAHLQGTGEKTLLSAVHGLAMLYADRGKLDEAEKMYMRVLEGREKALGAKHTSTLNTVNSLGNLYSDLGKLDEAEKMYMQALEGYEKALGAEHTSTLDTVHNLGVLYSDQGKLDEAEKMYMRALQGCEKILGAEHTSTLSTVNSLGNLYRDLGKLEDAEKMYMRALEGKEKALGAEHASTLNTVNSLGNLYSDLGKLDEAEKIYMRALEGYEKALGAEHTSTLGTVHNLGVLYSDQGKLDEAEKMYMQALEGYEKALGAKHTSTLGTVHNLGVLYSDLGKLDEAEKMYMRALKGYEKILGAEHTLTLSTVNSLGNLYRDLGKLEDAEKMYMRALEGKEKALGAEHASTLNTVNSLGNLYSDLGKLEEAEKIYMRALEGYEKALGAEHTSTLGTVHNLGVLYSDLGKLDEAEKMYMRALEGYEKALGAEHTSTLDTVYSLGILYKDLGKLDETEKMYIRALKVYEKALGAEHTSTLSTVNSLGNLYRDLGKLDEAEKMYMRALEVYKKVLGSKHMSTIDAINNLGNLYKEQGRLDEAKNMYMNALEESDKAIDYENVSTCVSSLDTLWALGSLFDGQNCRDEARLWYSRALSGYENMFGEEYPKCQSLRDKLAALDRAEANSNALVETGLSQEQVSSQGVMDSCPPQPIQNSKRHRLLRKLGWARV